MKKTLLSALAFALILGGCVTTGPVKDPTYVEVVETGKEKDLAFDLAMRWMSQAFRSAKSAIEYYDKGSGTINAKGYVTVPGGLGIPVSVRFALVVDIKDDRARLSFTALGVTSSGSTTESPVYPPIFEAFQSEAFEMVLDFKKAVGSATNDW